MAWLWNYKHLSSQFRSSCEGSEWVHDRQRLQDGLLGIQSSFSGHFLEMMSSAVVLVQFEDRNSRAVLVDYLGERVSGVKHTGSCPES